MDISHHLPDLGEFSCVGNCLPDLIETSSDLIHLRDAQTGKYILGNNRCAKWFGLELADKLIGLTVEDLVATGGFWKLDFTPAFEHWKNMEPIRARQFDYQVRTSLRCMSVQRIFCTYEGFIEFRNVIKLPVLNGKKKIIAILSISQDLTPQCPLSRLLLLYREYYPDDRAIQQMLRYVEIGHYFVHLPTFREMQVLFALHEYMSRKYAARHLDISPNTLASHIQHLKEKLTTPNYNQILLQLRVTPMRKYGKHAELIKDWCSGEYF